MRQPMDLGLFDYHLPPERIAQRAAEPRDSARLMVLPKEGPLVIEHRRFSDLVEYLRAGDVMVLNRSRVMPARLRALRDRTGAAVEVLLLHRVDPGREPCLWEALVRPGRRVQPGDALLVLAKETREPMLRAKVVDRTPAGGRLVRFEGDPQEVDRQLHAAGEIPLPPYIRTQLPDPERYQTVYSREEGSAAAPTAGLHFTQELLERVQRAGVEVVSVLLHVGVGTFRPVQVQNLEEHRMHAEYFEVPEPVVQAVEKARRSGGRVWAVGTTSVRALESAADPEGRLRVTSGWTDVFIYPGYRFKVVDALVTNFHLPRSTLLALVCAFAGRERVLKAYRVAIREGYRFYSLGDAMALL